MKERSVTEVDCFRLSVARDSRKIGGQKLEKRVIGIRRAMKDVLIQRRHACEGAQQGHLKVAASCRLNVLRVARTEWYGEGR